MSLFLVTLWRPRYVSELYWWNQLLSYNKIICAFGKIYYRWDQEIKNIFLRTIFILSNFHSFFYKRSRHKLCNKTKSSVHIKCFLGFKLKLDNCSASTFFCATLKLKNVNVTFCYRYLDSNKNPSTHSTSTESPHLTETPPPRMNQPIPHRVVQVEGVWFTFGGGGGVWFKWGRGLVHVWGVLVQVWGRVVSGVRLGGYVQVWGCGIGPGIEVCFRSGAGGSRGGVLKGWLRWGQMIKRWGGN